MSNVCRNQIVVVGPVPDLARFKREACNFKSYDDKTVTLCLGKLVPLSDFNGTEPEYRAWGCCEGVLGSWLRVRVSKSGFGCLDFKFDSSENAPIEFVRNASKLFPALEFHINHVIGDSGKAGKVTYLAGKPINEAWVAYIDPDDCLKEYLDRPGLVPWMEGLLENPDSPKPYHNEGDPE